MIRPSRGRSACDECRLFFEIWYTQYHAMENLRQLISQIDLGGGLNVQQRMRAIVYRLYDAGAVSAEEFCDALMVSPVCLDDSYHKFWKPLPHWSHEEAIQVRMALMSRFLSMEMWREHAIAHGAVVIEADIPGVDPKDIEVNMDKGVLSLRGERKSEHAVDDGKYTRVERARGIFHRRFALPDSANPDGIRASGRNGVLEIDIPKRPEQTPRRIDIEVA